MNDGTEQEHAWNVHTKNEGTQKGHTGCSQRDLHGTGQDIHRGIQPYLSIEEKKLMNQYAYIAEHAFGGGIFLFHPNIEKALQAGLNEFIREADEYRSNVSPHLPNATEQIDFYQSLADSCRAAIAFADRHADLAESMAGETDSADRKADLLKIVEICRHVPANPPRNFHEGLHSLWLIYISGHIPGSSRENEYH